MDKKKTGNLIREARQCKNYTQSELGRMLGVTNKAVSRWENGESFPDIGVLESLSHLLELPIQDIVTGERAGDREEAVPEVVRLAKLQEQRKREKRILYLIVLGLLIYNCVIGICLFSGRGLFGGRDIACQVAGISMAGTLTMLGLVYRYFGKEEDVKMIPSSQLSRGLGIASLAMLLWSVGIMYLSFGMVRAGSVPLGMELSSLGPFLNNQLCAGYALNVIFLAVEMYRLLMERTVLHPGCVISPAVIYLDFFYIEFWAGWIPWTASGRHWTEGRYSFCWRQCRELYFCLYSPTVLVLTHPIAHTNLREDILGLGRILFQLSADVRHVDSQDLVIIVHVGSPDGIHDIAVGQDSAGIFR